MGKWGKERARSTVGKGNGTKRDGERKPTHSKVGKGKNTYRVGGKETAHIISDYAFTISRIIGISGIINYEIT